MIITVTSQQEDVEVQSQSRAFLCWVCMFSPCLHEFALGGVLQFPSMIQRHAG
uniref:Uncharacterized protein n=1 Tax=Anguilla anguilla TaxID=7936 RepID=A0A0E9PRY5_ANGAN